MNVEGDPYVIEYNVRLGDPETESVIPRIESDLVDLFIAVGQQKLNTKTLEINPQTVATVMLVSGGYPQAHEKGKIISHADQVNDSFVFHAGTTRDNDGNLLTCGGRVLAITSFGEDIQSALALSNKNAERITFDKKYYRKDIGKDLIK
jgi:phosphoribosylamine--glycine ligase